MIYVENLMKSSKINKFNLVAGYKIKIQKSTAFLYALDEQ